MKNKTVILVGSGHAHLEVVKALTAQEIASHRYLLLSPSRQTYYSGLIPRFIAGEIEEKDLTINSADFAESKGFQFIQDEVLAVDQDNNSVSLKSGKTVNFDVLSINVGGTPVAISSDSPHNTIYLRPFDDFMKKWRDVQRSLDIHHNISFVVVGGGAAAVEVAAALRIRLNKNQQNSGDVHLLTKGSRLCENYSPRISENIKKTLVKQGIHVHLQEPVVHIQQNSLRLRQGENLRYDFVFVVTPSQPSKMLSYEVDSKLRLASNVFAVGDGTAMIDHPQLPRSGVIAVYQGRHLVSSLRKVLSNIEPSDFKVKKSQLNILITGRNSACLVWGGLSLEGRFPLQLKNWIDRKYMHSFGVLD